MKYWNFFLLYSILGHLFETIINLFSGGESGILYGFWTPIYGIGVLTILGYDYWFHQKKHPYLALFFASSITLSFFEWIGGNFLEQYADEVLWDYSSLPLSFGRYVSLEIAFVWGILSVIFVKYIHPFFQKLELWLPKWWTISLTLLFFVDLFWTIWMKFMV